MTNKIDELWGEALDKAVPDTYSSLTWTQVEKIKQVFAELIVKEVGEYLMSPEFIGRSDLDWSMVLNEHFGVK